jgi:hypothetical protein
VVRVLKKLGRSARRSPLDSPEVQEAVLEFVASLEPLDWADAAAVERRLLLWHSRQSLPQEELTEGGQPAG